MSWRRYPTCFELLSPLHVGFLPNQAGTVVARSRCYVPGKNLWGAVTESLTQRLHSSPGSGDYRDVGEAIQQQAIFSYFYLSVGTGFFPPKYADNGLVWGNLSDSAFRARFIGSNVSTAIGVAGGAEDASLHEIEFVRHRIGSPGRPSEHVLLMGMIWIRDDNSTARGGLHQAGIPFHLNESEIVVGGERNSGFGRMRWVPVEEAPKIDEGDWWPEKPDAALSVDSERTLIGHAPYRPDQVFKGEIEVVAGREYRHVGVSADFHRPGIQITNAGHFFTPGTRVSGEGKAVRLDPWGRLTWA